MEPIPKQKTHRDKKYLLWLRSQPCAYCGLPATRGICDVVPMHKGGGMALKGDDKGAIPGCCTGSDCNAHGLHHKMPGTFEGMLHVRTGKSWKQHAQEHWKRYQD